MYGGQGKFVLGERFFSGALSGMLSAGMLVALVGLSAPGSVPRREKPSLATFELAAPEGNPAEQAKPAEPPPSRPVPVAAPPETPLPRKPVKLLPHVAQPVSVEKPVQVAAADTRAPARAPEAPAAPAAEAPPEKASEAKASPSVDTAQGATYKGKVWRHLQRFRRSNVVGPGSAFVGFSLEDRGKVTELSIVRTSGSSRFDGEALQMVRRAEPFPAPPPHVAHAFIFEIKGN